MSFLLLKSDARRIPLADGSVQCVVTSPPYFGLRDYGTAEWIGGSEDCDHKRLAYPSDRETPGGRGGSMPMSETPYRKACGKCGAQRVDSQLGLEPTLGDYIASMVDVFREVRRVLRDDGTLWLNIGDTYAGHNAPGFRPGNEAKNGGASNKNGAGIVAGFKPKDRLGVPHALVFALRDDGWYWRDELIWHKPAPMPESVTDRCTKAHEFVFLLTKNERYYFDQKAISQVASSAGKIGGFTGCQAIGANVEPTGNQILERGRAYVRPETCNPRSVWTINTQGFPGSHFATMPPKLAERCIKAGTSEKGCCPACGSPWARIVDKDRIATRPGTRSKVNRDGQSVDRLNGNLVDCPNKPWAANGIEVGNRDPRRHTTISRTAGWQPCGCNAGEPVPCLVLDPFNGAGTTGLVAEGLGRNYVGGDLSSEYLTMSARRISRPHAPIAVTVDHGSLPLFAELTA